MKTLMSKAMIQKDILKGVVENQQKDLFSGDSGTNRSSLKNLQLYDGIVTVLTGLRRAGKSTFLKQIGKSIENFNYVNFEDIRLNDFEITDFQRLDEVFSEMGESKYIFLDEVQDVPKWEKYARSKQEGGKSLVITGSNSKLLSSELATLLTGRHLKYELFPFSYPEYLDFSSGENSNETFSAYLDKGGIPEYHKTGNEMYLQQLFEDILLKDVVIRNNIRNVKPLKQLAQYLISNIAKPVSFNSLKKILEFKNTTTVSTYISFLEDAYLFFMLPMFSYSLKQQIVNPKKIYSIDTGMVNALTMSFSEDKGRLFENLVFLHFRRLTDKIYYFRKQQECDFIVNSYKDKMEAYQVCYHLTPDNQTREINGLLEAMNELSLLEGTIITFNQNDKIEVNDKVVHVVAAGEFLKKR